MDTGTGNLVTGTKCPHVAVPFSQRMYQFVENHIVVTSNLFLASYRFSSPPCSPGPPGNSRQAGKPSRLVASWVNKFYLAYLKQCVEFLCMAAEKPWAGYFGCGKDLGGLFGPRKNLGRAILAAETLGRALFWLRKNNAHAHILEILHKDSVFLIHRKPSEEHFCEVRITLVGWS